MFSLSATRGPPNWLRRWLRSWRRQRSSVETPCSLSGSSADPVWRMPVKPSTPPPAAGDSPLSTPRYENYSCNLRLSYSNLQNPAATLINITKLWDHQEKTFLESDPSPRLVSYSPGWRRCLVQSNDHLKSPESTIKHEGMCLNVKPQSVPQHFLLNHVFSFRTVVPKLFLKKWVLSYFVPQ